MKRLPNILTTFRIILLPFFVYFYLWEQNMLVAGVIFVAAGLTDVIDGFIARKWNVTTELGKALDPLADKLLHLTVTSCIAINGFEFMWVIFGVLLFKDAVLIIGTIFLYNKNEMIIPAAWYGKVSSLFLYFVILAIILFGNSLSETAKTAMTASALSACILAGIGYVLTFWKVRKAS